jgi:hypothetical protein
MHLINANMECIVDLISLLPRFCLSFEGSPLGDLFLLGIRDCLLIFTILIYSYVFDMKGNFV